MITTAPGDCAAAAVDTETFLRLKIAIRIHTGSQSPQVRMVRMRWSALFGPAETDTEVAVAEPAPGTTTVCAAGWY